MGPRIRGRLTHTTPDGTENTEDKQHQKDDADVASQFKERVASAGALEVGRITRRGMDFVGGVADLGFNVNGGGSRSWIFRARVGGDLHYPTSPKAPVAESRTGRPPR